MTVDQHLLPAGVTRHQWHAPAITASGSGSSGSGGSTGLWDPPLYRLELQPPTAANPVNLVSSLCTDGLHRPLFDYDHDTIEAGLWTAGAVLDVPRHHLVAVNSTTHWHIYAPTRAFTWPDLVDVLWQALRVDLLNWGYVRLSLRDGGCYLRPPGQPWHTNRMETIHA